MAQRIVSVSGWRPDQQVTALYEPVTLSEFGIAAFGLKRHNRLGVICTVDFLSSLDPTEIVQEVQSVTGHAWSPPWTRRWERAETSQ